MKRLLLASITLALVVVSGTAMADNDCVDPVANWQSREVLRQRLEQQGWKVQRIKVDDGCYEVRGVDRLGNNFKAKYAPASLRIQKLEIEFNRGGVAGDYLDHGRKAK